MPDLDQLQEKLCYRFQDAGLLRLALTHPSVAHEQSAPVLHNQRLEFLGDAVLQLTLTRELYDRFPNYGEGSLTKARAQLVNQRSLAEEGLRLGIGAHLILSRGEEISGGRLRPSIIADAFEAILGAIYLDGGYSPAHDLILRLFRHRFSEFDSFTTFDNPKGELQELLQSKSTESPVYRMESVSGPDHDRVFECSVHHGGTELGRGGGKSKKAAETQAALAALATLRK